MNKLQPVFMLLKKISSVQMSSYHQKRRGDIVANLETESYTKSGCSIILIMFFNLGALNICPPEKLLN